MSRTYPKTCGRCGQGFDCGLSRCWCGAITVSDTQYEQIVQQYQDCLCPACLSAVTQHPSPAFPADSSSPS